MTKGGKKRPSGGSGGQLSSKRPPKHTQSCSRAHGNYSTVLGEVCYLWGVS